MKLTFKIILSLTLALSGISTFAATEAPAMPQPDAMESVCLTKGKVACLNRYGIHWGEKAYVIIEPALEVIAASGTVLTVAVLTKMAMGETEGIQLILTGASAGLKAGMIVIAGGVLFTVAATFATAGGFLLQTTSATASKEHDQFPAACPEILQTLKDHGGLGDLSRMTPQQIELLLPCLPRENELDNSPH